MKITNTNINRMVVRAKLNEEELEGILGDAILQVQGMSLMLGDRVTMHISKEDKGTCFEWEAEVTVERDN